MSFLNIIDDGRGSTGLVKGSTDVPRMRFVERLVAIGRVSTWNPLPIGWCEWKRTTGRGSTGIGEGSTDHEFVHLFQHLDLMDFFFDTLYGLVRVKRPRARRRGVHGHWRGVHGPPISGSFPTLRWNGLFLGRPLRMGWYEGSRGERAGGPRVLLRGPRSGTGRVFFCNDEQVSPHRYELYAGVIHCYLALQRSREAANVATNALHHLGHTPRILTVILTLSDRVLPSFTSLWWVLPSFTGFLLCFIEFYRFLLSFELYYLDVPGFTGFYLVLLGFT